MKKSYDVVGNIIEYELGGLSANETIKLFAELIKSGTAWSLQGSYGSAAEALIDAGYVSVKGKVLRTIEED